MEYVQLGKTGLKISRLGFGGIPIQRIDAEGTKELIHKAMEAGVNYIDTARGYTVSEEFLGYALEGIRDHFVIATKSMARDREGMARDIDISLKNLRTDYIDLYQVHNPGAKDLEQVLAPGGALEALQEAKAAGKIGHIGITLHVDKVFEQALDFDWVETIMFPYNFIETQGEELIARCKEKNIGFIAMKPLAGGSLENGSLAMRYIVKNPAVSVVIPGMAEISELEQNAEAVNNPAELSEADWKEIQYLRDTLGTQFCRRCNYCAPCTVGIPIPFMFTLERYLNRYDLQNWAKSRYAGVPANASECIECGLCEKRCPYNLPIRQMLKKVAKDFAE